MSDEITREAFPENHPTKPYIEGDDDERYYNNLSRVFPGLDCSDSTGYCISSGDKTYRDWEQDIAEPAIRDAGYKIIGWFDGERDSFGPLSRYCVAAKDRQTFRFLYG